MPDGTTASESPTVVLVHGAFADASSWNGVIKRLQAQGVPVTAPANPLRGVSTDSAYIAGLLEQIPGPVVAVGHSYGGAVITNAATKANNAVGLVYVAAFATDEGERLADATGASKDAVLSSGLVELHYPAANGELAVEFAVDPARFPRNPRSRPFRRGGGGDGRHPTAYCGVGFLRHVGTTRLEARSFMGCRRHR